MSRSVGIYLFGTVFWLAAAAAVALLAALVFVLARAMRPRFQADFGTALWIVAPLGWGAALPFMAPLLDAFFFWPTAPPLAALGIAVGGTAAVRRWSAARAADGARDEPGRRARRALAVAAALVPLLLVADWLPPSGDEPHYLIVAHSLVNGRDLDLADDYRSRVYAPYHPDELSPHYRPGLAAGSRYSMHGVGLPLLLAPAYAAGRALGPEATVALPRALLALLYGGFAWLLFGFITDVAGSRAAARGTAAATLLAPLLFAPSFLFPEVPAMLLALFGFRTFWRPASAAGTEWIAGAALAALPFVGVKYIPLAGAVVLVAMWRALPGDRIGRALRAGAPLAAALTLHGAFTWVLYGSVSPAAIYLGAGSQAGAPALGGDWGAYLEAWPMAVATAIGYLLDQKEGLLAYGPHYLLVGLGGGWLWRRDRSLTIAAFFVGAAYVGPYALSQQLGGQGPPVRPLMAVLWLLAPALGVGLELPLSRAWSAARGGLVALAAMLTAALAAQPELLPHDYPVLASRLLQQYAPHGAEWWRWFPQWTNVDQPNWWITSIWTLVLGTGFALLWRLGTRIAAQPPIPGETAGGGGFSPRHPAGRRAAMAVVVLCCGFVLIHHLIWPLTDRHRSGGPRGLPNDTGATGWVTEQLPEIAWAEPMGVWVTPGRVVDFVITSAEPLGSFRAPVRAIVPTDVTAWIQGAVVAGSASNNAPLTVTFEVGPGGRHENLYAYHGRLYATRGASPRVLSPTEDNRTLGAFLQLHR